MEQSKESEITKWIDTYQSGKRGIYPFRVSILVSSKFQIPEEKAREYVIQHIAKTTNEY